MNIQQYFGLADVSAIPVPNGPLDNHPQMIFPEQIIGLELEIEQWPATRTNVFPATSFTTDGSLRGSSDNEYIGIEAITYPIYSQSAPTYLTQFFKKFSVTEDNYSERCSIHVHVNVLPLTFQQLAGVCLVYQTVERMLFEYVGNNRSENIFCVPWYQCNLSYTLVKRIESNPNVATRQWQKYAALNLLPVSHQGTIEFRHLHGTCDVKLITNWINIIGCIMKYALNTPLPTISNEILNMNTVSNYKEWMQDVFGQVAYVFHDSNIEYNLSRGVIDSKLTLGA